MNFFLDKLKRKRLDNRVNIMTTHVYSIEFVDRQPNQRHNDTLDGAVWYGIRHFRYMDFVERMDFDTID